MSAFVAKSGASLTGCIPARPHESFCRTACRIHEVNTGLREGSVISPILYSVYINALVEELAAHAPGCGVCLGTGDEVRIQALLYADDVVLLANSAADLQQMLDIAEQHAKRHVPQRGCNGTYAYLLSLI